MPESFSSRVKEELSRIDPKARHCRIAEAAAMLSMGAKAVCEENKNAQNIVFRTENVTIVRKYFTLLKKTFNIETDVSVRHESGRSKGRNYILRVRDDEAAQKMLQACRLVTKPDGALCISDELVVQHDCCRRSFIRGAFLASGSINDPVRSYHFEIVCASEDKALLLQKIIASFGVTARIIPRKAHFVVYVKDSSQVIDLLNIMGAYKALMDMENVRIVKDMRNRVNRNVNCETANIGKTAAAAVRQINDIEYIMKTSAFYSLPQTLQETARLRLENPEATLSELGRLLEPPVGKSGVNHRLKKLSQYAQDLRDQASETDT